MYIITQQGDDGGAFAIIDKHGYKTLYFFQEEDDAERYALLLEAEDYPDMEVVEIDPELAIKTCDEYNYKYAIITPDEFVIPPRSNDNL